MTARRLAIVAAALPFLALVVAAAVAIVLDEILAADDRLIQGVNVR